MSEDDQERPSTDAEPPPDEAFALVGHEIRAELIQVLGGNEVSLSELRSRLTADVEPSQLHYHLQQLVGHFVEQTDKGYRLNSVGHRLRWTLRAGSLDRREEQMTVAANFACYYCGAPVEAIFAKGRAKVDCSNCEHYYMTDHHVLPLDAFADEAAAFSQFSEYMVLRVLSLGRSICPSCGNSLTTEFNQLEEEANLKALIDQFCYSCGASWWQTVGMACLADPQLIAFCHDHGIDILSTPHWELEFAATDEHMTVRSTDPWEVALVVTFDDETLELVVDGDLNVLERNRLDTSDQGNASLLRGIQMGVRLMGSMEKKDAVNLPDQQACIEYLRRRRWPDGVVCPHCDSSNMIKKGTTGKDAQRYRCQDCESIFNDLTGTIFAEYGLSLPEMFYIIQELEGTDATQLARQLDRSYQTVLDFIHDVQDALADEPDDTLSGA